MSYKTLGLALFGRRFDETRWYPSDAFETDPPTQCVGGFYPPGGDLDQRYGGIHASVTKNQPRNAKGNLPGFFHGRERLPDEAWLREFLDLDPDWSFLRDMWAKEDLKYVCDVLGQSAYQYLLASEKMFGQAIVPSPAAEPTNLSKPDVRAEELRSLILGMSLPDPIRELFHGESWVNMKVFVVAAINLYRKVMSS